MEAMKAPRLLSSLRWLDAAAAWRPKGGDRLELWLPCDWPGEDAELRWRRTESGGALAVAVTRRERMEGWLAALAAAGLAPGRLAPVTLSLPLADGAWTLGFSNGEMVLRSGLHAGFGGPRESQPPGWLHTALAEARAESKAPERILLVDAPGDLDADAWRTALGLPLENLS